jgi:hypothetical protein
MIELFSFGAQGRFVAPMRVCIQSILLSEGAPPRISHRLWNNQTAIWFHRPGLGGAPHRTDACAMLSRRYRSDGMDTMSFTRPAARTIGSSGGNWVRSAKDERKKPAEDQGSDQPERNLGDALRQAYDEAVSEAVPDDLLDLLKKLD